MSQHDYNVANAPGATVRADINALAGAIASQNSGATAPAVTFANQFWYDTTNSLLKIRNPANSAWITIATISGSTMTLASTLFNLAASGSWFGTTNRIAEINTSGVLEIGGYIDFHPDASGTEDYRLRIQRATGANGATTITNSGTGGVNIVPGSGGFKVDGIINRTCPVGVFAPFGGTVAPTGWILCYGQNVSRTTYSELFGILSTTYGAGDGSTTFTLPDLRGRVVAGQDDMGGTSANRLTGLSGGLNGDTLGAAGGLETHTLTEAQLASHDHSVDPPSTSLSINSDAHTHDLDLPQGDANFAQEPYDPLNNTIWGPVTGGTREPRYSTESDSHTHTGTVNIAAFNSATAGSGSAHNNVQPTFILNYIVHAGA